MMLFKVLCVLCLGVQIYGINLYEYCQVSRLEDDFLSCDLFGVEPNAVVSSRQILMFNHIVINGWRRDLRLSLRRQRFINKITLIGDVDCARIDTKALILNLNDEPWCMKHFWITSSVSFKNSVLSGSVMESLSTTSLVSPSASSENKKIKILMTSTVTIFPTSIYSPSPTPKPTTTTTTTTPMPTTPTSIYLLPSTFSLPLLLLSTPLPTPKLPIPKLLTTTTTTTTMTTRIYPSVTMTPKLPTTTTMMTSYLTTTSSLLPTTIYSSPTPKLLTTTTPSSIYPLLPSFHSSSHPLPLPPIIPTSVYLLPSTIYPLPLRPSAPTSTTMTEKEKTMKTMTQTMMMMPTIIIGSMGKEKLKKSLFPRSLSISTTTLDSAPTDLSSSVDPFEMTDHFISKQGSKDTIPKLSATDYTDEHDSIIEIGVGIGLTLVLMLVAGLTALAKFYFKKQLLPRCLAHQRRRTPKVDTPTIEIEMVDMCGEEEQSHPRRVITPPPQPKLHTADEEETQPKQVHVATPPPRPEPPISVKCVRAPSPPRVQPPISVRCLRPPSPPRPKPNTSVKQLRAPSPPRQQPSMGIRSLKTCTPRPRTDPSTSSTPPLSPLPLTPATLTPPHTPPAQIFGSLESPPPRPVARERRERFQHRMSPPSSPSASPPPPSASPPPSPQTSPPRRGYNLRHNRNRSDNL